jgi:hypothetical protein
LTAAKDFLDFVADRGVSNVAVIGGAVRDMLALRTPRDIDVGAVVSVSSSHAFHGSLLHHDENTSTPVVRLIEDLAKVFHLDGSKIRGGESRFTGLEVQVLGLHSVVISADDGRRKRVPDVFVAKEGPSLFLANWELSINHCALASTGGLISHARTQRDLSELRAYLVPGILPLNWRAVIRATRLSLEFGLTPDQETISRISIFLESEGRLRTSALASDPYLPGDLMQLKRAARCTAPKSQLFEKILEAVS